MTLNEIIESTIFEVQGVIKAAEKVNLSAPEGMLRTKHDGNEVQYFKRNKGETAGCYLGKKDTEQIRKLEEKLYYKELSDTAKQEEAYLKKIKKTLEKMKDYNSVFLSIPLEKRHLISPYEHEMPVEDEEWIRLFNKKQVSSEIKLISQNGEHVRSKSELIIADRLKTAGIPYFYEDPLILNEKDKINCLYWHPDFRVQNVRTGKQYYWEHFGMLDNPEYCKSCQEKLELYAHYGYFPGDNLIITSESSNHGLNLEYVDCLIERYLK